MRRRRFGAVALAAGAMALALTATGGAQGPPQGERTIVLHEKEDAGAFHYVDAKPFTRVGRQGPRRISAGDGLILRIPEYSNAARTTRAATLYAHCTAMNSSRRFERVRFHCEGAVVFGNGQIVFEGTSDPGADPFSFAATGGTGAYEGARGQLTIDENREGGTLTIHLLATH